MSKDLPPKMPVVSEEKFEEWLQSNVSVAPHGTPARLDILVNQLRILHQDQFAQPFIEHLVLANYMINIRTRSNQGLGGWLPKYISINPGVINKDNIEMLCSVILHEATHAAMADIDNSNVRLNPSLKSRFDSYFKRGPLAISLNNKNVSDLIESLTIAHLMWRDEPLNTLTAERIAQVVALYYSLSQLGTEGERYTELIDKTLFRSQEGKSVLDFAVDVSRSVRQANKNWYLLPIIQKLSITKHSKEMPGRIASLMLYTLLTSETNIVQYLSCFPDKLRVPAELIENKPNKRSGKLTRESKQSIIHNLREQMAAIAQSEEYKAFIRLSPLERAIQNRNPYLLEILMQKEPTPQIYNVLLRGFKEEELVKTIKLYQPNIEIDENLLTNISDPALNRLISDDAMIAYRAGIPFAQLHQAANEERLFRELTSPRNIQDYKALMALGPDDAKVKFLMSYGIVASYKAGIDLEKLSSISDEDVNRIAVAVRGEASVLQIKDWIKHDVPVDKWQALTSDDAKSTYEMSKPIITYSLLATLKAEEITALTSAHAREQYAANKSFGEVLNSYRRDRALWRRAAKGFTGAMTRMVKGASSIRGAGR